MAKLPVLILNPPSADARIKGSPKFFSISTPSPNRQLSRLGPKFDALNRYSQNPVSNGVISDDTDGLHPEKAIVFELAQSKQEFKKAAEKLGLTWVDESDFSYDSDDDFYDKNKPGKTMEGRLYLTVPNQRAISELLRLWSIYSSGKMLPKGYKDWDKLFSHLINIRPWGAQDRLTPETVEYIENLRGTEDDRVNFEVELIFHGSKKNDIAAAQAVLKEIESTSTDVLDTSYIPEIRYHAILISSSYADAKKLLRLESGLLKSDEVAYLRPQAMSISSSEPEDFEQVSELPQKVNLESPVAALFDGVLLQNHELLKDRLVIDDEEDLERTSPVNTRHHGTGMASLILHGDIAKKEEPLQRKLYVQYLLAANQESSVESTPNSRLLLDVIYSAVVRLKNAPKDLGGDVFIINLSLGDVNRPFLGQMSAWGRLIDFLAWKYNLLFIISAGNISEGLFISDVMRPTQITKMTDENRHLLFINAVQAKMAYRSIFSPAEAINALTVGASHSDGCTTTPSPYLIEPYSSDKFPSLISGLGLGYKQSVKPEVLNCGGRALYSYSTSADGLTLIPGKAGRYFGQQVAGVSSTNDLVRTIGTSNSAALATRAAVIIHDELKSQFSPSEFGRIRPFLPSLVKGLIVHSASWGSAGAFLENTLEPKGGRLWKNRRSNITRFLGYGKIDYTRVLECTKHRVTMLGVGNLECDGADLVNFPLPKSLSGKKDVRKLVVTLAWLSPTKPAEQFYKDALLDFVTEDTNGSPIGVSRVTANQPPSDTSRRGTVIHEIYEGEDAVPIAEDDILRIRIECRTQGAGGLPRIPYALIVTFEVASTLKANIYSEIREGIVLAARNKIKN
ncbi:S8 family peptidase [Pectobacterium versatile]|uniref:S8 family peptidase n=1 Tax=Pectobacterium versatile TaxID=2488639 RepID=UPI002B2424B2|nr:S8 family peptidase [Pectobacterium versatile]